MSAAHKVGATVDRVGIEGGTREVGIGLPALPAPEESVMRDEIGLRESPVTLGTESCGNSCRGFAGEAPTKLFRLAIGPQTRLPLFPCANIGLSDNQD